jgi:ribosomal 50S subunit-associated protein YjgA (DUF615 family)
MAGVAGRSGRKPNERVVRHFLAEILDEQDPESGRKRIAQLCRKLVEEAQEGKLDAIREVFDRLEGKPKQETDTNMNVSGSLEVVKRIAR